MSFWSKLGIHTQRDRNIAIVAGVGIGVALVTWYALSRESDPLAKYSHKHEPEKLKCVNTRYDDYKKQHLEQIVEVKKAILREEKEKTYSASTLQLIQDLALSISLPEIKHILTDNRTQRRGYLDTDKGKYEQIVLGGADKIEKAFNDAISKIYKDLQLDSAKYDLTLDSMQSTHPELVLRGRRLYKRALDRVQSTNQTVDYTRGLNEQVHDAMHTQWSSVTYTPTSIDHYKTVKESMLYDNLFKQYRLEQEDIRRLYDLYSSEGVSAKRASLERLISQDEKNAKTF